MSLRSVANGIAAPTDRNWFWTIIRRGPQLSTVCGYAGTCEEAMAAFKGAWSLPDAHR